MVFKTKKYLGSMPTKYQLELQAYPKNGWQPTKSKSFKLKCEIKTKNYKVLKVK